MASKTISKVIKKKEPVVAEVPKQEESNAKKEKEVKEEKRDVVLEKPSLPKLEPNQRYFETPDGEILIGETDKQQLWSRKMNNGKGGWANPKR